MTIWIRSKQRPIAALAQTAIHRAAPLKCSARTTRISSRRIVFAEGKKSDLLRERRVTSGLTQQQVADRAGIKLQQYQKFESGERNLRTASFQIACKVLEALDLDIVKYFHKEYAWGKERYLDSEGWKYKKTGKHVTEDVE